MPHTLNHGLSEDEVCVSWSQILTLGIDVLARYRVSPKPPNDHRLESLQCQQPVTLKPQNLMSLNICSRSSMAAHRQVLAKLGSARQREQTLPSVPAGDCRQGGS
jgi:hypothetical protein